MIFRRVRMPAYRAARGESPRTAASKPKRVREYRTQSTAATRIAIPAPSGSAIPPWTCTVAAGQTAELGRSLLVGKTLALKPLVCRKYDWLLKIRYVSR